MLRKVVKIDPRPRRVKKPTELEEGMSKLSPGARFRRLTKAGDQL